MTYILYFNNKGVSTYKMGNISKIIKNERIKQGISQRELARRIGCTGRAIGYWEAGIKIPSLDLADKALKVLGISLTIGAMEESP